jgi:Domain of unknown function (DUF4166)
MTSLFAEVLGPERFAQLDPPLQRLHAAQTTHRHFGEVAVERGRGVLARFCAWAADLPPTAIQQTISVEIAATTAGERWTRRFGSHVMRSNLSLSENLLAERLGLLQFLFSLDLVHGRLVWTLARVRALGISLPLRWFEGVHACEFAVDGIYRFDVKVRLPLVGLVVHYHGFLNVE